MAVLFDLGISFEIIKVNSRRLEVEFLNFWSHLHQAQVLFPLEMGLNRLLHNWAWSLRVLDKLDFEKTCKIRYLLLLLFRCWYVFLLLLFLLGRVDMLLRFNDEFVLFILHGLVLRVWNAASHLFCFDSMVRQVIFNWYKFFILLQNPKLFFRLFFCD